MNQNQQKLTNRNYFEKLKFQICNTLYQKTCISPKYFEKYDNFNILDVILIYTIKKNTYVKIDNNSFLNRMNDIKKNKEFINFHYLTCFIYFALFLITLISVNYFSNLLFMDMVNNFHDKYINKINPFEIIFYLFKFIFFFMIISCFFLFFSYFLTTRTFFYNSIFFDDEVNKMILNKEVASKYLCSFENKENECSLSFKGDDKKIYFKDKEHEFQIYLKE